MEQQHRRTGPTPRSNWDRVLTGLNKLVWFAGVALLAFLGHEDNGFIKEVWEQAKTASPFAAMLTLLLYLDERRERREAQRQCQDRTIEFVEANNLAHNALEKMATAVSKRKGH